MQKARLGADGAIALIHFKVFGGFDLELHGTAMTATLVDHGALPLVRGAGTDQRRPNPVDNVSDQLNYQLDFLEKLHADQAMPHETGKLSPQSPENC